MQHDHSLSLATTASGMVGGVGRAIAEQHSLSSISLHGVVDVAFYAVVSASVGYCVKVAWDYLFQSFRNRNSDGQKKTVGHRDHGVSFPKFRAIQN